MHTYRRTGYAPGVPRIDIPVPGIPQPLASYTPATRAGDLVFAAGHLASDFKQGVAPEAHLDSAFPYYGSAIKKQTRYVLENLKKTFEAAGTSLGHVVKAQVFLTDLGHFSGFDEVWREYFPTPPPRTTIGTSGLLVPGCLVEVDLTAVMPRAAARVVQSSGPRPLANYSEAVVVGDLVFAAGQLASDFQERRPARGARRSGVSVLRLGYQAPDALRSAEPGTDVRGGRHVARSRRQGAGVPHGPEQLLRVRRGLARVLPDTAAADDHRDDGAARQGHAGRDRPDRGASVGPHAGGRSARHSSAARALHAGHAGRRSRVRGRPDRERLQDRRAARGTRRSRVSVLRLGCQAADALRARESREDVQGRRHLARPGRQGAGVPHGPRELRGLRRGVARVLSHAAA